MMQDTLPLHILVIDDDRRLCQLIVTLLQGEGMRAHGAGSAKEAEILLASHTFDVMILDIMMEGEDGLAFTQRLWRDNIPHPPILLLTARDTTDDCIEGLNAGADDYLSKPFEPGELIARLHALHRRGFNGPRMPATLPDRSPHLIHLGEYTFDTDQGRLKKGEEYIFLTSSEMTLLSFLALKKNIALTREALAQGIGRGISERSVDVQIARLRRKIGDDSRQPRYLQTVRHIGYGLYPDDTPSDVHHTR